MPAKQPKKTSHVKIMKMLMELLAVLIGLLYLSPLYIVVVNSFKDRAEMYENIIGLPSQLDFSFYKTAMEKMSFLQAFLNSSIITIVSSFLLILLSSVAAWMLVRTKHIISDIILYIFVATMLIPFQAIMMPLMQFMGTISKHTPLEMLNTRYGLIYMYIGFGASLAVFLFHGFIKSVPLSLEEAATIDGCSKWMIYWKIIFPILKPISVTVMILNVKWIWNDFLLPSLVLSSKSLRTIPLSTFYFFGEFTIQWNLALAGLVMTMIPVVIFYIVSQKYIIEGVTAGSVK